MRARAGKGGEQPLSHTETAPRPVLANEPADERERSHLASWTFSRLRRRKVALGLCVALVLVTLPFVEVLFGSRTLVFGDAAPGFLPRWVAAWTDIRHGLSPFWWPNIVGGLNTLGAGQSGIFYLPNAIFGLVAPVLAYRLWFFLHLWLMVAGWYAWSWRRWRSVPGAIVSALAGTINGYLAVMLLFVPWAAELMLLPWMFLTLDLLMESKRVRYVALLGFLVGAMVTLEPQFLWITLVALGICAAFTLLRRGIGFGPWLRLGSALLLGAGLGAAQLLPVMQFSQTSIRPRLTETAAFEYSTDWSHLLTLLLPNRGGPATYFALDYLGLTFVVLALIGVSRLGRNRFSLAMVTIAALGVLSSLGGRTFVGHFMFTFVPYANRFRSWNMNLVWINIAVAILAGAGVREVLRMPRRWAIRLTVVAAGLLVVMLLLPAIVEMGGALHPLRGAAGRFTPPLLLFALAGSVMAMTRFRVVGIAALIAVCAARPRVVHLRRAVARHERQTGAGRGALRLVFAALGRGVRRARRARSLGQRRSGRIRVVAERRRPSEPERQRLREPDPG